MELIEFFGEDYVMFGTDYPMWSAADEIVRINNLPLTDAQKEKIFHLNAERLLGI